MNTKTDSLESIAAERVELDRIKARVAELEAAVTEAQTVASKQADRLAYMATPQGLLQHSNKEIETATNALRDAQRAVAKAEIAVQQFADGPAKDLPARTRDNERRKFEAERATERAVFFNALKDQLVRLNATAAAEREIERLALAAGFARGPVRLLSAVTGEATDYDRFRRDVASFNDSLLDPEDPQLRVWRAMHGR